jgi:hypothetical protein
MTEVAALLGDIRGLTPPAEFYHPAVARRKLRQDLRALQEADGSSEDADGSSEGADASSGDSAGDGPAAGTAGP